MTNRKTTGANAARASRKRGRDPREDEDDDLLDPPAVDDEDDWSSVLPPDGEFRLALFEVRQPGNARDYLGTFTREQIGEDLATFLGSTFGGGHYGWKLKNARGKWANASESKGRALGGEIRISERAFPRVGAPSVAAAAPGVQAGGVDLVSLLMQRESKAHELLLKAIEGGAGRQSAPPLGIAEFASLMKLSKDLSPVSPVNSLKDLAEAMAMVKDLFPGGDGGGGSEMREFGELIQMVMSQQAPAALPAPAAAATAAAQPQQQQQARGGAPTMQQKLMAAMRKLPDLATQGMKPADAVEGLLYDWTAREVDQLESVLPGVTLEKVKGYLRDFEKHKAWYEEFFKCLTAYFAEDTPGPA